MQTGLAVRKNGQQVLSAFGCVLDRTRRGTYNVPRSEIERMFFMKIKSIFALLLAIGLCLSLLGCSNSDLPENTGPSADSEPERTIPPELQTSVEIQKQGKVQVSYTINLSSVKYITSASALPDHEVLADYDDAWFADHALVLVYETVSSGSVDVSIASIQISDSAASVILSHTPAGTGTTVMTTWLLWAEVDAGLSYDWSVSNPALESNASEY